jgi:ubiquinone/menaquinone biosynthesis C-methylase UbiE
MREYIYSLLDLHDAASLLDIGCGDGYDLLRIGSMVGKEVRLIGIDTSSEAIEKAVSYTGGDSRYSFEVANLDVTLPFETETIDIVYSMNFLECIVNIDTLIKDIHRVLRPGGQVVFAHFDWEYAAHQRYR